MKIPSLGGVGQAIGSEGAGAIAHYFKAGKRGEAAARNIGGQVGKALGDYAPLALMAKDGAIIKRRKGKQRAIQAILHTGEAVLPMGVPLTKGQRKAIVKRQKGKGNTYVHFC